MSVVGPVRTDRPLVKSKDLPGIDALEARLYFKGFCGEETIVLKAQLDISQFDKIYLPVQSRSLIHPYSDASECTVAFRCQKIEESSERHSKGKTSTEVICEARILWVRICETPHSAAATCPTLVSPTPWSKAQISAGQIWTGWTCCIRTSG